MRSVCFLCRISCIPTLSVDPESRRLLHVAGGTLKVEVETSQELQCRLKSERQIDGIQGDSDIGALPRVRPTLSALVACLKRGEENRSENG